MCQLHLFRAFVVAALSLAVLSACAGNGSAEQATEAGTTDAVAAEVTTDTGPPPITADEKRWVQQLERLANRMEGGLSEVKVITDAVKIRFVKTYSTCLRSLKRAGDPGRLEPAARLARRACLIFQRSANLMRETIAMETAGLNSEEEADRFVALSDRAFEAQGNGINAMELARSRAQQISSSLPPE